MWLCPSIPGTPNDLFLTCVRPADLVVWYNSGNGALLGVSPSSYLPPRVRGVLPPLVIAFDGRDHFEAVTCPLPDQHAPRAGEPKAS